MVDNVLWIITDDQMRWTLSRIPKTRNATRMRAAGYDTGYFGTYMNGMARDATYVAPGWGRWVVSSVGERERVNVDGALRDLESRQAVERFAFERMRRTDTGTGAPDL